MVAVSPRVTAGYEAAIHLGFPTLAWAVRGASPPGLQARSVQPIHLPCPCVEGQAHQAMSSPHEPLHPGLSGVTLDPQHSVSAPQEGRPSAGAAGLGEAGADAILMETQY